MKLNGIITVVASLLLAYQASAASDGNCAYVGKSTASAKKYSKLDFWVHGEKTSCFDVGALARSDYGNELPTTRVVFPIYPNGSPAGNPVFDVTPCDQEYTGFWQQYTFIVPQNAAFDSVSSHENVDWAKATLLEDVLSLVITPSGSQFVGETGDLIPTEQTGWFRGQEVTFYSFGDIIAEDGEMRPIPRVSRHIEISTTDKETLRIMDPSYNGAFKKFSAVSKQDVKVARSLNDYEITPIEEQIHLCPVVISSPEVTKKIGLINQDDGILNLAVRVLRRGFEHLRTVFRRKYVPPGTNLVYETSRGKKYLNQIRQLEDEYNALDSIIQYAYENCETNVKVLDRLYQAASAFEFYADATEEKLSESFFHNHQFYETKIMLDNAIKAYRKVVAQFVALKSRSTCLNQYYLEVSQAIEETETVTAPSMGDYYAGQESESSSEVAATPTEPVYLATNPPAVSESASESNTVPAAAYGGETNFNTQTMVETNPIVYGGTSEVPAASASETDTGAYGATAGP
ncbi:hypothetical protein HDU76_004824 [Blyttiomyces sp. JEL0837]|nr:hypothetical protein HDU76_004824 [Blyttiomyces sp. JEL0837]